MKLQFFTDTPDLVDLRPNEATRPWMDSTFDSFAYRCLPLNIANAHGWSFHLPKGFTVEWDGRPELDSLKFTSKEHVGDICASAFGHGILTFFIKGVFRTEPGWNLHVSGPANKPKYGIYPLTGIIETDWSPYSFTMNWRMSRPGAKVTFKKGEPFCTVFPVQRQVLQDIEPEILPLSSAPALKERHDGWAKSRRQFIDELPEPETEAYKQRWQKSYYRGLMPDGERADTDHIIKLRLKEFKKTGF